ncbi:MAG: LPS assembly lipoprotein LptE [Elusimicrobiaceae bacterium]|nr:LPS assembly lipoprotein LptE [Elusimicrobiaceae bacterium]
MAKQIKLAFFAALALLAAGCAGDSGVIYQPYPQILPQSVTNLAVQPFINKTEYFGLEDRLNIAITNEFLRNGNFPVVPQPQATGVIMGEIRRYILVPIQYDAAMVPTSYKLTVLLKVQFYDRKSNTLLWEEPALEGTVVYTASVLSGGITEDQARDQVWSILARDIVTRTVTGYGSVSSASERKISPTDPVSTSTAPVEYRSSGQ